MPICEKENNDIPTFPCPTPQKSHPIVNGSYFTNFSLALDETSNKVSLKKNNKKQKQTKNITETCLYNLDPLKPHFYIVKLGFTGVYIIFLIPAPKHRLWVLVRTALPRRFYRVPTIYVLSRKYQFFLSKNCLFLKVKFSIYLNSVFV